MARRPKSEQGAGELSVVAEQAGTELPDTLLSYEEAQRRRTHERKLEAASLRLAGFSHTMIATRLGISAQSVRELLRKVDEEPEQVDIPGLRALENDRLDRAQAAIWTRVLAGDDKAIATFLAISTRRARLNGMDEAVRIDLSIGVRQEMEAALANLQDVVLGQVISTHDDVTGR